jgi:hypothetical protein
VLGAVELCPKEVPADVKTKVEAVLKGAPGSAPAPAAAPATKSKPAAEAKP